MLIIFEEDGFSKCIDKSETLKVVTGLISFFFFFVFPLLVKLIKCIRKRQRRTNDSLFRWKSRREQELQLC